jgi:hypothetical protein
VTGAPAELPGSAGGGYGSVPHAGRARAQCLVGRGAAPERGQGRSKPIKLSHVVLNSAKIDEQTKFSSTCSAKFSDATDMMDFIRAR